MLCENMINYLKAQESKRLKRTKMLAPAIVTIIGLILPIIVFAYLQKSIICACLLAFVSLSQIMIILLYNILHINKYETLKDNLIINSIFYILFTVLFSLASLTLSISINLNIFLGFFIFLLPYIIGSIYIATSAYKLKKEKIFKTNRMGNRAVWLGYFASILFLRPFISGSGLYTAFFIAISCYSFLACMFATRTDKLLELYCANKLETIGYDLERHLSQ